MKPEQLPLEVVVHPKHLPDGRVLCNRLRIVRVKAGVTQLDLADAIMMRREALGLMERGAQTPTCFTALELAQVLNVDVNELFYLDREQP